MGFFNRKDRTEQLIKKEAAIQKERQRFLTPAQQAAAEAANLARLLEKDEGVAFTIFLATGGDRRIKR